MKLSQLTIQGWILRWRTTDDCTTILGPVPVLIKIIGISNAVKDSIHFMISTNTSFNLFNIEKIYGVERYVASVYLRNSSNSDNKSVYQEIQFETPPKGKI